MAESFDESTVINALTDGVGLHFGVASRKSFYEQLKRLQSHEMFRPRSAAEKQRLVDLLAMAAFFQTVIIPIRSSAKFVGVLRSAGATHLRVAGEKLGPEYARRARATADSFGYLLSQLEIPEHLLMYPTLKDFIRSADKFRKG